MLQENRDQKYCKVCGGIITGRSDKIFCTDSCRIYFNNIKYRNKRRIYDNNIRLKKICSATRFISEQDSLFLLKIVLAVAQICKIMSTFDIIKRKTGKNPQSIKDMNRT